MTPSSTETKLEKLLDEVRACRICEDLPLGPNPVLRAQASAKILIVGQAPGTKVHKTSVPFNDPSGDRLRLWMNLDRETFYDESKFAIIPIGLCYPGKGPSGDLPPRKECGEHWLRKLITHLPGLQLTLLVGIYAQRYYLGKRAKSSLTDTILHWKDYLPEYFPLPHPSPRNFMWLKRNPWFEKDVVLELRKSIQKVLP